MIKQLQTFITDNNLSQRQVADQLSISSTAVNQYLKGGYKGDVKGLEVKIKALFERSAEKILDKKSFGFVPTPNAKKTLDVIRYAHVECEIALITGCAGLGKTQALTEYSKRSPDVIFIETEPTYTAKILLKEICKKMNLDDNGGLHAMSESIVNRLKNSGRMIMIDEAELLPYRALEILRRIHDKAGIGLVLAGLPRLLMNLRGARSQHVQLYSRIAFHFDLGEKLDRNDINALAEATLGTNEFNQALFAACGANARRLNKLLRGVIRSAEINDCEINTDLINQFSNMLIH